jgi:hypothetical protein
MQNPGAYLMTSIKQKNRSFNYKIYRVIICMEPQNIKWTREEELNFIKEISQGQQIEQLATKHNRSTSSMDLRLKKIIYENVLAGKSIDTISKALKLTQDIVRQHFISYKEFREKYKGVADIDNVNPDLIKITSDQQNLIKNDVQSGGDMLVSKVNNKIKQLESENNMIRTIIENKELRAKMNKMVKDGTIDYNVKLLIREFNKRSKK